MEKGPTMNRENHTIPRRARRFPWAFLGKLTLALGIPLGAIGLLVPAIQEARNAARRAQDT
jgi:hypothetical protein